MRTRRTPVSIQHGRSSRCPCPTAGFPTAFHDDAVAGVLFNTAVLAADCLDTAALDADLRVVRGMLLCLRPGLCYAGTVLPRRAARRAVQRHASDGKGQSPFFCTGISEYADGDAENLRLSARTQRHIPVLALGHANKKKQVGVVFSASAVPGIVVTPFVPPLMVGPRPMTDMP